MNQTHPDYLSDEVIEFQVRAALAEDIGHGDLSAALLFAGQRGAARVRCREAAILCGQAWFERAFRLLDPLVRFEWYVQDGDAVPADSELCRVIGQSRALLSAERTALNFLQLLSGTATTTRQYVEAIAGTGAVILDTRKTLPGLRLAQKYAVLCGGGHNHRLGLYDAVMLKENHIAALGSIGAAVEAARREVPEAPIIVEAENPQEIEAALAAGVEHILLDNLDLQALKRAVDHVAGRARLEASGGVTLETIRAIAETGVDYISVGSLTKQPRAIDLSLRFEP